MLASVLTGVFIAIRDFLIVAALSWVGISIEAPETGVDAERACAGDACQQPAD